MNSSEGNMDTTKVDWVDILRKMLESYEPDAVDLAMYAAEKSGKFVVIKAADIRMH
jgi:3-dehydroquinate dehydratase